MRQTETGSKILGRSPKVTWDSVTGRPAPPVRNQCTFTPQLCCHLPCLTFFPARIPSAFLRRTSRYDPCSRWDASCPRLHACVVPCRGLAWLTHLCRQCERAREDPFWRTPGFGVFGRLHVRWYSNSVCKLSRFNGRMPRPAQPVLALQSVSVWAPTVPLTCALQPASGFLPCIVLRCTRALCIRSPRISSRIYEPLAHAILRLFCPNCLHLMYLLMLRQVP